MNAFALLGLDSNSPLQITKLNTSENQFELFKKLYDTYDMVFILESLVGPKELSEISIIGFDPELSVKCDSTKFVVANRMKVVYEVDATEPLSQLRELMPRVDNSRFRYIGGAVGYIGYDAIRFWENLPISKKKSRTATRFPLLEFGIYTDGILYDHSQKQAYYFFLGNKTRIDEIQNSISMIENRQSYFSYSVPRRSVTKKTFLTMVRKAKKYIYDGDIFQVVLAKNMEFSVNGDFLLLYESLREVNPSPYMYLLKMSDRYIIGSSPEMLVRVTDDYVETFPIAGTRPILADEDENQILREDLLSDEKEIAEHTMLVDLARNDIGRVCKFGTVKVDELMAIKRFSHVQHIVSHVTGRLNEECDSFDALKAVFPAGTVSGAPKIRAMEIIDELEPTLRQVYAGALGYFSFNGSCDFAITIRSLFINKKHASIQSGAGIVMDSNPQIEWFETEQKAKAMLSALKDAAGKKG